MSLQIARNIKAFLERTVVKGPEAYAWAEAHQFVQAMIADLERHTLDAQPTELAVK